MNHRPGYWILEGSMRYKDEGQTDVSADLLRYLQRKLELPNLDYLDSPRLIAEGTEALIWGFQLRDAPEKYSCSLVLRIPGSPSEPMQMDLEHAVQNAVADQGFPAPRVLLSSQAGDELGRPFLIMARVSNDLPMAGLLPVKRLLAAARRVLQLIHFVQNPLEVKMEALARLHSLNPIPLERALEHRGVSRDRLSAERGLADIFSWIDTWKLDQYRPLADWLQTRCPAPGQISICHGDPHPMNMLISKGKLAGMIDWEEAQLGHPELDVGAFCGHIRTRHPFPLASGNWTRHWQRSLVDKHLAAYEQYRPLDREAVRYYETEFLARVMVYVTVRQLRRIKGETVAGNPLMDNPRAVRLIQMHLEDTTGIEIPLPEDAIRKLSLEELNSQSSSKENNSRNLIRGHKERTMTTEQIEVWKSDFGKEYTARNTCNSLEEFNQIYLIKFGKTKAELTQSFLGNILNKTSKILEVGANVGYQLRNLQTAGYRNLYGVEIQRDAVDKGKIMHPGIDIIEGSALDIPFKDNFFDMVLTETVLIHFSPDDIDLALDEIYRCSRKYIWGVEYFAEQHTEVKYHGRKRFVWHGDFARKFLQRFPDLNLLREERLCYLNEEGKTDSMFLLEKK